MTSKNNFLPGKDQAVQMNTHLAEQRDTTLSLPSACYPSVDAAKDAAGLQSCWHTLLAPTELFVYGIPFFFSINCTVQLCVICKLAECTQSHSVTLLKLLQDRALRDTHRHQPAPGQRATDHYSKYSHTVNSLPTEQLSLQIHLSPIWRVGCHLGPCQRPYRNQSR